jgi:hypothetical protein
MTKYISQMFGMHPYSVYVSINLLVLSVKMICADVFSLPDAIALIGAEMKD